MDTTDRTLPQHEGNRPLLRAGSLGWRSREGRSRLRHRVTRRHRTAPGDNGQVPSSAMGNSTHPLRRRTGGRAGTSCTLRKVPAGPFAARTVPCFHDAVARRRAQLPLPQGESPGPRVREVRVEGEQEPPEPPCRVMWGCDGELRGRKRNGPRCRRGRK